MNDGPRFIEAPSAGEALARIPFIGTVEEGRAPELRALWPEGEAPLQAWADQRRAICDERNWRSGLHGGARAIVEGRLFPSAPARGADK